MKQTQCLKVELHPETGDEMITWLRGLNNRLDEVIPSIAAEGIHVESLFTYEEGGKKFLIFYVAADDLQKSNEAFAKSTLKIDEEARDFMARSFVNAQPLEVVAHFDRILPS